MAREKLAQERNHGFWHKNPHGLPRFNVQAETTWNDYLTALHTIVPIGENGDEDRVMFADNLQAFFNRFNPNNDHDIKHSLEQSLAATVAGSKHTLFRTFSIMTSGQAAVNVRTGEVVATDSLPVTDTHRQALQTYGMAHIDIPYTYTLPSGTQLQDHDEFIAIGSDLINDIIPARTYGGGLRVALSPREGQEQETRTNLFRDFRSAMIKFTERALNELSPQEKMITPSSLLTLILSRKEETLPIYDNDPAKPVRLRLPQYGEQAEHQVHVDIGIVGDFDPKQHALALNSKAAEPKPIEDLLFELQLLEMMTPEQMTNLDNTQGRLDARKHNLIDGLVAALEHAPALTNDNERLQYLRAEYCRWFITPISSAAAFTEGTIIQHFLVAINYTSKSFAEAEIPAIPLHLEHDIQALVDNQ